MRRSNLAFGANGNHNLDWFNLDLSIVRHLPRAKPNLDLLSQERVVLNVADDIQGEPGAIPNDNLDDTAAIQAAIAHAKSVGATEIAFQPGVYNLAKQDVSPDDPYFTINDTDGLVFDGKGATFIVGDHARPLIYVRRSSNVIIQNLTVDYAERVPAVVGESNDLYKPLTFTQGYITEVDPGGQTFTLSVNLDAFIAPDETFLSGNGVSGWGYVLDKVVDGRLKENTEWHYPTIGVSDGSQPGEFIIATNSTKGIEVGDRYTMSRRHNRSMIGIYNQSEQVSVINVTAYSAPSSFVASLYSDAVNVIDSQVVIRPDDWTNTPDTQRWKSSNADGVHIQSSRVGAWVENSEFNGLGDDVMNFYSRPMTILEKFSDNRFLLAVINYNQAIGNKEYTVRVGDILTFFDPVNADLIREARVEDVEITKTDVDGRTVWAQTVTFDQAIPEAVIGDNSDASGLRNETSVYNRNLSKGAVVQNSRIANSRRYGNFLMTDNALLVDNLYEGLSDEAIAGHNEPGWPLGLFASDVVIQGNQFQNIGFSRRFLEEALHTGVVGFKAVKLNEAAFIAKTQEKDLLVDKRDSLFENLQIRDNIFYQWGKSAISVRNSQHVVIANNAIMTSAIGGEANTMPLDVHFADNVRIESNSYVGGLQATSLSNNGDVFELKTQGVFENDLVTWLSFDDGKGGQGESGPSDIVLANVDVADGRFDQAVGLNGSSRLSIETGLVEPVSRTVGLWFNLDDVNSAVPQVIYSEGNVDQGLNLFVTNGSVNLGVWKLGLYETFMSTQIEAESWNHVALVLDSSTDKFRGYLNGRKFGFADVGLLPTHDDGARIGSSTGSETRFGSSFISPFGSLVDSFGSIGAVDDVRIYERSLGDAEIASLAGAW